jgi:hypothetical protein
MNNNDFHDEIDEFALAVELKIIETRQLIAGLPEFENRGQKAQKLQQFFHGDV